MVVDGVMYVTTANECHALDAGTGRRIWHYQAPAHEGPGRRRRRRHQPRRGRGRRPRVHGHRPRPPHRPRPLHGHAALGHRDGRLAPELRRDLGAPGRGRPGGLRHFGRRRRHPRLPGRLRSSDRQGGVALLDRTEARRAGIGNLEGQGHRPPVRVRLAHRHLRPRARHALLADRQSLPGLRRQRAHGRQPLLRLDPGPRRPDAAG